MDVKAPCPVCGCDYRSLTPTEILVNGQTFTVPPVFAGALDWSPYVMLQLMQGEWLRPAANVDKLSSLPAAHRPSSRALVVLTFWTYFETLMSWFYEAGTRKLPSSVAADLLRRYGSIGSRLDRLHKILFGSTYANDLDQLGQGAIRLHLENVQQKRNAFVHGNPESINDALVEETVRHMPDFNEAWIQSFNMRCAKGG